MALGLAIFAALFTGTAMAANGPAGEIGADVWLGLFSTVIFALLAGYSKGLEKRIERMDSRVQLLEHEDKQKAAAIALMRETVLREHPSRAETAEHRAHVESQLQHIRERLDFLARPHHRSGDR